MSFKVAVACSDGNMLISILGRFKAFLTFEVKMWRIRIYKAKKNHSPLCGSSDLKEKLGICFLTVKDHGKPDWTWSC